MQRSEDKEKECPVCYEQGKKKKKICENNHKVCEKCLFSLRKRQCPICKCHFKIKKNIYGNQATYEVLFNQQDKQHNGIAADEDIREEQQAIRQYYERFHTHQNFNPHHQYHHSPQYRGHFSYLFTQPHPEYQFQQRQIQQEPYEIVSQIQHETFMRDPEYRENFNQQIRIIRRNRDQQMYARQIREPHYQHLDLSQTFNQEEKENCGLLDKIGQFFISIGQILSSNKEQKTDRKIKNQEENKEISNNMNFEQENIQVFNNEINQNINSNRNNMQGYPNQQNMGRECNCIHHQTYNPSQNNFQQYHYRHVQGVSHNHQQYNFPNVPYQYQYQYQPNHNYQLRSNIQPYSGNHYYPHQHYYHPSYQQNRLENPQSRMQYQHNSSIQGQYSHYQNRYD